MSLFAPTRSMHNDPSLATADDVASVSTSALIGLRHSAESLPLKIAKIKSRQSGQYYSSFRGRGMEFDEVRLYQPGDDVRTLDWKVTARSGKAHTKLFREERERAVLLWVDFRSTMFFATRGVFKSVVAAKTAALLAWSAHHQKDRSGALLFSDNQHHELRPRAGKTAVLSLLHSLSAMTRAALRPAVHSVPSDINGSHEGGACYQELVRLRRVSKPGSLIFLISDFREFDYQAESVLTQLSRHNDVVMIFVYDPLEQRLPESGYYRLSNSRDILAIDTSNQKVRQEYENKFLQRRHYLEQMCHRHRLHFLSMSTQDDIVATLQNGMFVRRK